MDMKMTFKARRSLWCRGPSYSEVARQSLSYQASSEMSRSPFACRAGQPCDKVLCAQLVENAGQRIPC